MKDRLLCLRTLLKGSLLFLVFISSRLHAQVHTVKGTVSDTANALSGVSVKVQGGTTAVSTDAQGNFSIQASGSATLIFSSVGYKAQRIQVNGRETIEVLMQAESQALGEVVVVGYGTQKKRDLTGAITTVKAETFKNMPTSNLGSMLNGRAAGVQVTTNSGTPGGAVTINIRGNTSLNSGNDPLYVIDGVPTGDITTFNPNDIASLEVLKDASASAIYGARAANGVIIITTKRGITGKTQYEANAYAGVQQVARKIPMLNAKQQYAYVLKGIANYNRENTIPNILRLVDSTDYLAGGNINWQDQIFRTAAVQNYDFSVRGGQKDMKFAFALGEFNQDGVIINSGYKRYNGKFNFDLKASQKVRIGASAIFSRENRRSIAETDDVQSVLGNAMRKTPYEPVYNADGTYTIRERTNPVAQARLTHDNTYSNKLLGSAYLEYDVIRNLTFKTNWAIDYFNSNREYFLPSTILGGSTRPGSATLGENTSWLNENTLTYSNVFNEIHNLTALVGYSVQENNTYNTSEKGSLAATNIIYTLNASAQRDQVYSYKSAYGISSLFGRVNYALKNRYLLSVNMRQDGSSRFGKSNKYAFFPAASLGWRISDEPFFKGAELIQDLKLRVSAGKTGNQNIGNYLWQGTYVTGADYAGDPGVRSGSIPVENLTWESTNQYNVGVDLTLLHNRLTITADAYVKRTSGLLFNVPLPSTTGFSSTTQNLGNIENRGIELNLTGEIVKSRAFSWNSSFNISFNRNKVIALPDHVPLINTYAAASYYSSNSNFITQEGKPIGSFYGYKWTGQIYATDEAAVADVATIDGRKPIGGTFRYQDISGINGKPDGKIDSYDRQPIGSPFPDFTGGLNNQLVYGNFDLNLFIQFVYGNRIFNQTRFSSDRGFVYNGATTDMLNAWDHPGQITNVHKAWAVTDPMDNAFSSAWIENGSYLRLKDASLGYNLSPAVLAKLKVSGIRVYVSSNNLLTITHYKGFDPEVNVKSGDARTVGVDIGAYPQVRSFLFGINVKF
jgi:TonB-linked SusC/RagA family outer membrane protein